MNTITLRKFQTWEYIRVFLLYFWPYLVLCVCFYQKFLQMLNSNEGSIGCIAKNTAQVLMRHLLEKEIGKGKKKKMGPKMNMLKIQMLLRNLIFQQYFLRALQRTSNCLSGKQNVIFVLEELL